MQRIRHLIPLLAVFLFCAGFSNAQSSFDIALGLGTAHDKANGGGIDSASSNNAFGSCAPSSGDPFCEANPSLGGVFMGLSGDVMLSKMFGVGAEVNFQPAKDKYGPLQYRQTFYDFNGIFAPLSTKRAVLQLQGGIGGARSSFSFLQNACVGTAVCTNQAQPVGTSNHFQLHAGVGVQLFVTGHIFIKPQVDVHYVRNFTQQFGSNMVPAAMISVGYSFGDR